MLRKISENLEIVKDKEVIIRVDYNVPIINGGVGEKYRIEKSINTIQTLLDHGARKIVLISHRGRPSGRDNSLSLRPLIPIIEQLLDGKVLFAETINDARNIEKGVVLLENIRFWDGEISNDEGFINKLVSLGEVFINEAFSVSHRKHASVYGIAKKLKSFAGLWLEKEIVNMEKISQSEDMVLILGGGKLETKLPVIENLAERSKKMLLGGALIFPFIKAKELSIGKSKNEEELVPKAKELLDNYKEKLVLPQDLMLDNEEIVNIEEIPADRKALDIGPEAVQEYIDIISSAKNIFWNGPMGMYEDERFRHGTIEIARGIAESNAFSVIGGGDTLVVIEELGLIDRYGFVSTGGGASLSFLAGKRLPGLEVLGYYD